MLAVENVIVVIPGRRLVALVDYDLVVCFLDYFAGLFVFHFGMIEIEVFVRYRTVLTVRQHKIDALGLDRAGLHLVFCLIRRDSLFSRHNVGDALVVYVRDR